MNEDTFWIGLSKDPGNADLRLIFADWLEEQGRIKEAATHRWMVKNKKWPSKAGRLWWWSSPRKSGVEDNEKLNDAVMTWLYVRSDDVQDAANGTGFHARSYMTQKDAVQDLVRVYTARPDFLLNRDLDRG